MFQFPVVTVSVGNPITIPDITRMVELPSDHAVKNILEQQIKEHYSLYGTEPYRLEYCRNKDSYQLRPNSIIGRINCGSFILQVSSKFREIEIGKWLQLAHYSGATSLVRHNNDIAEKEVSDQDKLEGIDYFALSFVSAVYDCINQGLLYVKGTSDGDDPNFRGKLHVTKHIQKGANPMRLQTTQNIKDYDCNPNAVIKKALETCIAQSSNRKLLGISNGLLPYFKDISTDKIDAEIVDYEFVSSLPRPDYEKALSLSKIILEGFAAIGGGSGSFNPYYTIDLDALFEKFVTYDIKRILKDRYEVHAQSKIPHSIEPELEGNFIAPDLFVHGVGENQGRAVVIDTKNKYSMLDDSGRPKISNQDLYQMVYYCLTVGTNVAILVYPGDSGNCTKYPLLGSEGKAKYKRKREQAVSAMFNSGNCGFTFKTDLCSIHIIAWRLNLSGTLRDTRESVAQLSQFTADCVKQDIL